jgi:hypothetical protein
MPTVKKRKNAITDHHFFVMKAGEKTSAEEIMNRLRGTTNRKTKPRKGDKS